MEIVRYGVQDAKIVLLQMIGDHESESINTEIEAIEKLSSLEFSMITVKVDDWNRDLSPWEAPPVFGKEPFGGQASKTLEQALRLCADREKTYYIGGYSLAGLFAIWAAYQTDTFAGVAAASPSMWFPGFTDYMREGELHAERVYLSLGDKEAKTKNSMMRTVKDRIEDAESIIMEQGASCILEWNPGNHFKEPDLRTAKAFAWLSMGYKVDNHIKKRYSNLVNNL